MGWDSFSYLSYIPSISLVLGYIRTWYVFVVGPKSTACFASFLFSFLLYFLLSFFLYLSFFLGFRISGVWGVFLLYITLV